MNSRKNLASNWMLYPVPNDAPRRYYRRAIWNGVYCILDGETIKQKNPVNTARFLFKSGAAAVQLRYKNMPSYKLLGIAKKIAPLAKKYKKTLLINDRPDVALACGACGVHVGSGDISVKIMRVLLKPKSIVGKTVHSLKEAGKARREKVSYVSAGPVFATPLKANLRPRGVGFVKKIKKRVSVPVFAIGGINSRNAKTVLRSGADGVCVTRAAKDAKKILKLIS